MVTFDNEIIIMRKIKQWTHSLLFVAYLYCTRNSQSTTHHFIHLAIRTQNINFLINTMNHPYAYYSMLTMDDPRCFKQYWQQKADMKSLVTVLSGQMSTIISFHFIFSNLSLVGTRSVKSCGGIGAPGGATKSFIDCPVNIWWDIGTSSIIITWALENSSVFLVASNNAPA